MFHFFEPPRFVLFLVNQDHNIKTKPKQVYYKKSITKSSLLISKKEVSHHRLKKTTKLEMELPPNLASMSAHWLASRNVCTTLLLGMAANSLLQSNNKGSIKRLALLLFISMTMLKASISTIRLSSPSCLAISSPSRRAHNSA